MLTLPKEHGAWGILLGSFFSAVALTGSLDLSMILLLLGFVSFYLTFPTFILFVQGKDRDSSRYWALLFFFLGCCFLFGASVVYRPILIWSLFLGFFLLAEAILIRIRKHRTLAAHLFGTMGLTSIAPLAYILHERVFTGSALRLWLADCIFFAGGILFARFQIAKLTSRSRKDPDLRRSRGVLLTYYLVQTAALVWIAIRYENASRLIVVFIPSILVALLAVADRLPEMSLRRTGWLIIAQTLLFVLLFAWIAPIFR